MKTNRFFSCFTSICVGISMLSAPICIAANAETDPYDSAENTAEPDSGILQETAYDYEGAFKVSSYPWFNWVGEEPDFSEMKLELLVKNSDGKYSATVLPFSFTVKSGLYSGYYTIDTSAVDSTKEGSYEVRILPKAGEIMTVSKDRDYRIKLTDHAATFTAQYHEKQMLLHFSSGNGRNDLVNCQLNEKCTVGLYNVNGSEIISCVINDPSIAEIVEADDRNDYCNYKIRGLQTGETVITAETADGRTASCVIRVAPFEELFPDTTTDSTTVVSSSETTTTALSGDTQASATNADLPQTGETVITAETADDRTASCALEELFSDTTTESTTVVSSSETTTTALSGDTEASAANEDLPQTGNRSPRTLLIVLGASWLIGFGMLAVIKSGAIGRREEEQ